MSIKKIDRVTCRVLGDDMEAALQAVAEKHGVDITQGRATYMDANATFKFEVAVLNAEGVAETKEYTALKQAVRYTGGLELADLDVEYNDPFLPVGAFKITGFRTRARKNPFIVTVVETNKQYTLSETQLMIILQRHKGREAAA